MCKIEGFDTWPGSKILFYHRFRQDLSFRRNRRFFFGKLCIKLSMARRQPSNFNLNLFFSKARRDSSYFAPSNIATSLIFNRRPKYIFLDLCDKLDLRHNYGRPRYFIAELVFVKSRLVSAQYRKPRPVARPKILFFNLHTVYFFHKIAYNIGS